MEWMNIREIRDRHLLGGTEWVGDRRAGAPLQEIIWHGIPRYSTDTAAAFLVVEKLRADGLYFDLSAALLPGWVAHFWDDDRPQSTRQPYRDTAAHAVCLAALLASAAPVPG
jgi:hypothetical protein